MDDSEIYPIKCCAPSCIACASDGVYQRSTGLYKYTCTFEDCRDQAKDMSNCKRTARFATAKLISIQDGEPPEPWHDDKDNFVCKDCSTAASSPPRSQTTSADTYELTSSTRSPCTAWRHRLSQSARWQLKATPSSSTSTVAPCSPSRRLGAHRSSSASITSSSARSTCRSTTRRPSTRRTLLTSRKRRPTSSSPASTTQAATPSAARSLSILTSPAPRPSPRSFLSPTSRG